MLVKLTVHNYALIKELDLELNNGLTIITGETGAGKSILLGALSLILGSRADTSVLLNSNEKCIVEGTFRIDKNDFEDFFQNNDLDFEPVVLIRREINSAGKSRAFINDTPVTLSQMKELGNSLIDIHSQHQTLMLNDNSFQLNIIDSFAGTSKLKHEYKIRFGKYRKLLKEFNEMKEKTDRNKADLEYYQFQLKQLEEAKLKKGEQEELETEQELLSHAEEIKLSLGFSSKVLSDDDTSVLSSLREIMNSINRIKTFLPETENICSRLDSAYIDLDDLSKEIDKLTANIEADPEQLAKVNARIDLLYSLIQKHRVNDLDGLLTRKEEIEKIISSIETTDQRYDELESLINIEKESLSALSEELSGERSSVLLKIEIRITELLKQLGMPNAKFRISLSKLKDFTSSGIDDVVFLFSANKQTEPENLAKIASGGELSRVMLSLKSLLTENNNLPTIIFDEIDSGVSGGVADKVGQILAGMGQYMQVINITHLPQVASRGTKHYHIFKEDMGDSTITRVKLLTADERVLEVARLLSGSAVTETAIKNAKELLQSARN